MERLYAAWRGFQEQVLAYVAAVILLACTLLAGVEVIRRYLFGVSFYWQQDAVTYFILSAVFLFFGIAQRREGHLTVTAFVNLLEGRGRALQRVAAGVKAVAAVVSFVFVVVVFVWGVPEAHESQKFGSRTESLLLPLWPFLYVLLAGFAIMGVSLFFQVYRAIQAVRGRIVLEEAGEEEGLRH